LALALSWGSTPWFEVPAVKETALLPPLATVARRGYPWRKPFWVPEPCPFLLILLRFFVYAPANRFDMYSPPTFSALSPILLPSLVVCNSRRTAPLVDAFLCSFMRAHYPTGPLHLKDLHPSLRAPFLKVDVHPKCRRCLPYQRTCISY